MNRVGWDIADFTRCGLAMLTYGGTLWMAANRIDPPSYWWALVFTVTGAYFALEMPVLWRISDAKRNDTLTKGYSGPGPDPSGQTGQTDNLPPGQRPGPADGSSPRR